MLDLVAVTEELTVTAVDSETTEVGDVELRGGLSTIYCL